MKVDIFYGKNISSNKGECCITSWDSLVERLSKPRIQKGISQRDLKELSWYNDYSKKELKELKEKDKSKWDEYQSNKKLLAQYKNIDYIIGAKFRKNERNEKDIVHRNLMALDVDNVAGMGSMNEILKVFEDYEYFYHTSFSHLPERPKFRIFFPLRENISDKNVYESSVKNFIYKHGLKFEDQEGIGEIDLVSSKFNQLMFLPNRTLDGEFLSGKNKGKILNLNYFHNNNNNNLVLTENQGVENQSVENQSVENKAIEAIKRVVSPYDLKGANNLIKEFCVKYNICDTINYWLSDVYKKESDDTYTYMYGSTNKGLKVYNDSKGHLSVFAYTFHSSDPLFDGKLHNSFDLIKVHKFKKDMSKTIDFVKSVLNKTVKIDKVSNDVSKNLDELLNINPWRGLDINMFYSEVDKYINYEKLKLGFNELDKNINVLPGLYILGADTGFGKTTLMLQIADFIASFKKVIFFSLEMSKFEMTCKSLSRIAKSKFNEDVCVQDIMFNRDNEITENCLNEYLKISKNIEIIEGGFELNIENLKETIEKYTENNAGEKPIIFIDYLQVLQPKDLKMTDKMSLDYNIKALKKISRDLFIPIFLISSLNRQSYNSDLDNSSFKESGGIEYTADVLFGLQGVIVDKLSHLSNSKADSEERKRIWLEYKEETKRTGIIKTKLKCLKNRFGKKDFEVFFNFYPRNNYFEECENQEACEIEEYKFE